MLVFIGLKVKSQGLRLAQELGQEAHTPTACRVTGTEPKEAITALLAASAHHMFFAATLARDQPQSRIITGITATTILGTHGITITG